MTNTLPKSNEKPPFSNALMDPIMDESSEFLQNPYPLFEKYRERGPVVWSKRGNQWIVTGLEEANLILRDNTFGKKLELWDNPNLMARWLFRFLRSRNVGNMLFQDPPQHTRVRSLMQTAFLPATVRSLNAHIQNITDQLLAEVKVGDSDDLLKRLAFPLPVTVIAELLGIPAADRDQFKHWSTLVTASLRGKVCPFRALQSFRASRELRTYLRQVIEQKTNRSPEAADDLLTTLTHIHNQDEGRLSEEELLSNAILVLIAGHETTVNLIGNGVYHLLQNPTQKQLLIQNPDLIEAAVEEFLRLDPPVQLVRRIAYSDLTIANQKIKKGDAVTILIGACNRDPRVFINPDQLDIQRPRHKHLSFGAGIHFCLGAELARSEGRIAINTLLQKFPDIHLYLSETNEDLAFRAPFALRGLQQLPVVY